MSEVEVPGGWAVEHHRDSVERLHALGYESARGRVIRVHQPTDPALVLGSTQSLDLVDMNKAKQLGIEVVKRQSGGGAVYVSSSNVLWIDLELPRKDLLFKEDISHSFTWLGKAWMDALSHISAGSDFVEIGPLDVYDGTATRDEISRLVCFAGRSPGEVFVGNKKMIGLSQRRTRAGSLFQCAVALSWDPSIYAELLPVDIGSLEGLVYSLPIKKDLVLEGFLRSLADHG